MLEANQMKRPPAWTEHVVRGLKHPAYHGRTVGSLSLAELHDINANWLPKVRAVWDIVNILQREDAEALERALAHYNIATRRAAGAPRSRARPNNIIPFPHHETPGE